jgi:ubiquitin carboxyl-terminal hydrolase 22/27/51
MNNIFHEAYSGQRAQLSPHKLLYAVWQHSKHLAGYAQQDAHEFFIALLDGMHTHLGGKGGLSCDCIIHRIFTGALQSDVTCTKCESVSTTIDQFMDVSLDIRSIAHMPTPNKYAAVAPEAATGGGGGAAAGGSVSAAGGLSPIRVGNDATTLEDCLLRYTRTERLMSEIGCSHCGDRQKATKQMSFSKLPAVVCFHLKRFEHDATAAKISTNVRFPENLDMRPFLSQVINGKVEGAGEAIEDPTDDTYMYTLFSVVNHYGTLQNGHYTNYIRSADVDGQWFLCNDETVTMAPLSDVLMSEGYMLFYVKKRLEYCKEDGT